MFSSRELRLSWVISLPDRWFTCPEHSPWSYSGDPRPSNFQETVETAPLTYSKALDSALWFLFIFDIWLLALILNSLVKHLPSSLLLTMLFTITIYKWMNVGFVVSDYTKAAQLAKEYSSTKGPGTTAKPQDHLFFRKLEPIVQRTLDKCVRENGFMWVSTAWNLPRTLKIKPGNANCESVPELVSKVLGLLGWS